MRDANEIHRTMSGDVSAIAGTERNTSACRDLVATMGGVLAITWLDHQRIRQLCAALGFELEVMTTPRRGAARYLLLSARTLALLWRRRPRVLLVQNPSLVLATLAILVRGLLGFRLIVDAHNAAIAPYVKRPWVIAGLSAWLLREADLTIVSNRQLADLVAVRGGRPFVLPDRIPTSPAVIGRKQRAEFTLALIATFAADEPIAEVFEAVRGTQSFLYVTGDQRRMRPRTRAAVPSNVHFCGFLSELDYWTLLASVDGVVDLTRTADCLVCGAYEALAVGKPMLLSRSAAATDLFGDCALFTDNTPADIRQGLQRLRDQSAALRAAAPAARRRLEESWNARGRELVQLAARWADPE